MSGAVPKRFNMRLCAILAIICTTLSGAMGLQCYTCFSVNPGSCTQIWNCPRHYDRCGTSVVADNLITKECMRSDICNNVFSVGVSCCSGELCNGAQHYGIYSPLLLGFPMMAIVITHI